MKRIILYVLIVINCKTRAQLSVFDCNKLLVDYREKMKKIDRPKGDQTYFMDVQYNFITADSLMPGRNNMDVQYYMTQSLTYYKSNKADMYSDNKDFIIATHPNHSIIWTNSIAKDTTWKNINNVGFKIKDSLLSYSRISGCSQKDDVIKVDLSFSAKYQQKLKIRSVSYSFNKTDRMLRKVIISYMPGAKMVRSEIIYKKLDFNYSGIESKTAKAFVFDNSNRLKQIYKGYKIIDNRSKN